MHPMFLEGLNLMLVGMGVVFAFLVLLVYMVGLMSKAVVRWAPEEAAPIAPAARQSPDPAPAAPVDPAILPVIREAVRLHRAAGK